MSDEHADICIVCALPEELEAVHRVFRRRSGIRFESRISENSRNYLLGAVINEKSERLTIHLSCPPRFEGIELALHLKPVLQEFRPRVVAMTGICAGDKRDTHLGDLIVAEAAFQYDTGKFLLDERGAAVHQRDVRTHHPDQDLLAFARTFHGWKRPVRQMHRPRSLRSQEEWLLARLSENPGSGVEELPSEELTANAPLWRRIVERLRLTEDPLLDQDLRLVSVDRIRRLRLRPEPFPFIDPTIECNIKPIASGNAVRSDNPFDDVRQPVRSAIAVDMEGAAFYRTLADFREIAGLLVKGVCDFADPDKDDTHHRFAAEASARYVYSFLRTYVTADRPAAIRNRRPGPRSISAQGGSIHEADASLLRRLSENTAQDAVVVLEPGQSALNETIRLDRGLYVRRNLEGEIAKLEFGLRQDGLCLLIVGGAGTGKTSLLWRTYSEMRARSRFTVWFLKSSYLRIASDGTPQRRILDPAILMRAARSERSSGQTLLILLDTIDLLLHSEESRDFIVDLLTELKDSGCHTIVTCRHREARLLGSVVTNSHALEDYQEKPQNELQEAIETHSRIFYRGRPVAEADAGIRHVTEAVARGLPLKNLIANPLLMRMLFSIYAPHKVPEEIHVFRLYEEYWERRVKSDFRAGTPLPEAGSRDLSEAACATAIIMLATGSAEVDESLWVNSTDALGVIPTDRESLVARGIIRRSEAGTVAFFHQTFFEHSAARGLVARFGNNSLYLVRNRVDERKTDLFLAPVYEQALLLSESSPVVKQEADRLLEVELSHDLLTRRITGVYVYCHRRNVPDRISELVTSRIPTEDTAVIKLLLQAGANVSTQRLATIYRHLDAVWARRDDGERTHVLGLLERFANRAVSATIDFVETHEIPKYVLSISTLMTSDRSLVRILGSIATQQPAWAWEQLVALYAAASQRTVSQDLLVAIIRTVATNAQHFGRERIAARLEDRLPRWHGNPVSGFQALAEAFGQLWCIEWQAAGTSLGEILEELDRADDDLRTQARFAGIAAWAGSTRSCDLTSVFRIASTAQDRKAWLWTRIVIPDLLARHAELSERADVIALAAQMCWDALANTRRPELLERFRRSVQIAHLSPDAFNALFADQRFGEPDIWLRSDGIGELLVQGYLAGHPGAVHAMTRFRREPTRFDEPVRKALRGRLAENSATSRDVAGLAVDLGIELNDATGLTSLIQDVAANWPAVLQSRVDALLSLRDRLLRSRSGSDKRPAITLWHELVRLKVISPPKVDSLFELFDRLDDIPARAHVLDLIGTAAAFGDEPLDSILDRLEPIRTERFESIAEAAHLAIATSVARSSADACRMGLRALGLVLAGSTNLGRVSALGPVLKLMAGSCPAMAFVFCKRMLTAESVSALGAQAKRRLVHRLRSPVRAAIREMLPAQRRDMVDLVGSTDRFLGRILIEAVCREDFNSAAEQLDRLLIDDRTDSHIKEIIRRQKYIRERTLGGEAWKELFEIWQMARADQRLARFP